MSSSFRFVGLAVYTLAAGLVLPSSREMKLFFANLCLKYRGQWLLHICNKDDLLFQYLISVFSLPFN